ncbi:hypothetical protein GAMM_160034 [Gammaproteobacteria bacterium]
MEKLQTFVHFIKIFWRLNMVAKKKAVKKAAKKATKKVVKKACKCACKKKK